MFRAAQANPFDEAVGKATDENLTSENWELILDVCDKVGASDTGGKDAVAALIKRLAHRNANVQLYTLELANALSQNCGIKIHKELASRSFTDALLRLAADRNTHQQVKGKILERMEEWTEMFSSDSDLGIMEQAYTRLKSQNPNLQAPSKPFKQQITDVDRQKEEDELQMALALSIKDKPTQNDARKQAQASTALPGSSSQPQPTTQPMPAGTTAATVSRVRALYDFQPTEAGELQFRKGDIIAVLESVYKDWWKGSLRGQTGIFPLNYVEKLQDPTQDELERDAQTEVEVFAEIKNVEKLLALLSTSSGDGNARDNEEITTLYHSTLSIRPKLIELIGKYSQKKDDFTQLNEKFIKARRDYENLLEASMSQHPSQNPYGRPQPQSGPPPYGPPGGYPPSSSTQPYAPQHNASADPNRFYTASPRLHDHSQYPPQPQNGPAPFYMIPPGSQPPPQQAQQHQQPSAPPPSMSPAPYPSSAFPSSSQAQPQQHQPPPDRHSVASAQELAGSSASLYDQPSSPPPTGPGAGPGAQGLENNPYAPHPLQPYRQPQQQQQHQQPPPQQQQSYPPPDSSYSSPTPQAFPQQQQHHQDQSSTAPPPQPNYAPPTVPGGAYPPALQNQYSGGSAAGAGGAYSAYAPPAAAAGGPGGGGGGAGDVSDYYR